MYVWLGFIKFKWKLNLSVSINTCRKDLRTLKLKGIWEEDDLKKRCKCSMTKTGVNSDVIDDRDKWKKRSYVPTPLNWDKEANMIKVVALKILWNVSYSLLRAKC